MTKVGGVISLQLGQPVPSQENEQVSRVVKQYDLVEPSIQNLDQLPILGLQTEWHTLQMQFQVCIHVDLITAASKIGSQRIWTVFYFALDSFPGIYKSFFVIFQESN